MDTYSPEAIAMLTEMCNCDQDTALFLMESANGDIDAGMSWLVLLMWYPIFYSNGFVHLDVFITQFENVLLFL